MKEPIEWLVIMPQDRLLGGAEQLLMNLITHLSKNGKRCGVMFLRKKIYGDWEHLEDTCVIKYGPVRNVYIGYLSLIPRLISLSRKYKLEKSFTSQTLINAMLGLLKRLRLLKKTTVIVRESNSIFHLLKGLKLKRYTWAYKLGYGGVDLVICQTQFMKEQLIQSMPWMQEKLKIIILPNPIDLKMIKAKSRTELPDSLKGEKFLVGAGRLVPAKGFDIFINSYKNLLQEHPDLKLVILGEGAERTNLQSLINSLNLQGKVLLWGFVNNVYPFFKHASVCVLSSRIEGFPNVLLQMMSQNTKVVSTLSAGGIEDVEGVFTCEVGKSEELTQTILKCLSSETDNNRGIFDKELETRTVNAFITKTLHHLDT